jgi:hypothetical protein
MAALDCVINHTEGYYDEENYDIGRKSVQIDFGDNTWDFFENGNWFQRGNIQSQGKWVCDGDRDYKITNTLGEVYSSKIRVWLSSPKSDPKFYCVANALYHAQRFKRHKKLRGKNSISIIMDKSTWIFNEDKSFIGREKDGTDDAYNYVGTWKCLGNNTFEITDNTYGEKWTDGPGTGWVDLEPTLSCVRNRMIDAGHKFDETSDHIVKINTSEGKYSYFYKNKVYLFMMKEGNKFVRKDTGTWECDGKRHYKIFSKTFSNTYSSKTGKWDDTPIPTPNEEPTYDKSKFPLKLDSRGPEVVQLQNYLNKLIPFEPLVVNGIFDKKTQDKLIQLQKNLNLTK